MAINLSNEYYLSQITIELQEIKRELDTLAECGYPLWTVLRGRRQLFRKIYKLVVHEKDLPSLEDLQEVRKLKNLATGWAETLYKKEEDALKVIQYPAWLYKFARGILPDRGDWDLLFHLLPTMTEAEIRQKIVEYVYSNSYGSEQFHSIARKAWEAHLLIERALAEHKKPAVMSSWGKDSNIVLHLVRMHKPEIQVLWNDTTVEFPSTYELKDKIVKEWSIKNLITTRPDTTFWAIKTQYGWPTKGRGVGDKASEVCCKLLKKDPTKKAIKEHKWDLSFTGLNIHESWQRGVSGEKYGNYFYAKTWKMWRCYPIHNWTENDIWDYTVFWSLPVNEVYRPLPVLPGKKQEDLLQTFRAYPEEPDTFHWDDVYVIDKYVPGYKARTGCWPCVIGSKFGKFRYYRIFYPKFYRTIIFNHGLGIELLAKNSGGLFPPDNQELEATVAMRPCVFDRF